MDFLFVPVIHAILIETDTRKSVFGVNEKFAKDVAVCLPMYVAAPSQSMPSPFGSR